MRLIGLFLLFALLTALPAAGQSYLAQQCAAFGEAQYRKLDPTLERILPAEYPAPALERFEAKAGSQAVAAALTLRGRMAFRNRPALDTQFVCLLDAGEKPLFFYALPVLAPRGARRHFLDAGLPPRRRRRSNRHCRR